jgi:glyoxylase-like metal-dependent hydrolase (beta-lactamase superfamily II)
MKVIRTAGHSCDEVSYLAEDNLFIGDSVPVKGDIPIFIDEQEIRKTLDILGSIEDINIYYPAWDQTYDRGMMKSKLTDAAELIDTLKSVVSDLDDGTDLETLVNRVCDRLKMPTLKANPLFSKTIDCLR